MTTATYLVLRSPKRKYEGDFVTFMAVVDAVSKRDAIAKSGIAGDDQKYKAASAELLQKGHIYRL